METPSGLTGDCRLLGKPTRSGAPLRTFLCLAIFLEPLLNTKAGTRCCGSREKRSPPPQGHPPSGALQRLFPADLYSHIHPQGRERGGQPGTWVKTPPLPQSTWNEQDSTVIMIIKSIKRQTLWVRSHAPLPFSEHFGDCQILA